MVAAESKKEAREKLAAYDRTRANILDGFRKNRKATDKMWGVAQKADFLCKDKKYVHHKTGAEFKRVRHLFSAHTTKTLAAIAGHNAANIVRSEGIVLRSGAKGATKVPFQPQLSKGFMLLLEQFLSAYLSQGFKNAIVAMEELGKHDKVTAETMKIGLDAASDQMFNNAGPHPGYIKILKKKAAPATKSAASKKKAVVAN